MLDLSTEYLGLRLRSPLVVSSNPLNGDLDKLRRMEDAGAGAVVLPSLFEEQVLRENSALGDSGETDLARLPPALRRLPQLDDYNHGAAGYLGLLDRAKAALGCPVIASLNGTSTGGWTRYARLLELAGADALELNLYYLPTDLDTTGAELEQRFLTLLEAIRRHVRIPIAVKLSPFFSSLPNMALRFAQAGANGLVLFNRFYQPDFDPDARSVTPTIELSTSSELRLRLRWAAILYGRVSCDLAITGGVHTGRDAVKAILAGAKVAMTASALLANGIDRLAEIRKEMEQWLDAHLFDAVDDARGHMSHMKGVSLAALERANYVTELQSFRPLA
jgi:dihydroorotate dehydrogenase (fumarate)